MTGGSAGPITIEKTSDGGESWASLDLPVLDVEFQDIHFYADGQGVVLTRDLDNTATPTMIYHTLNDGATWQNITPEIVMNSGNRFWFVIDSETVWANGMMYEWLNDNAELIEVKYLRTPEDLSLRTYRYDPEKQITD